MNDVIQKIYDIGIVPVIAIDDAEEGGAAGESAGGGRAARWRK